MKRSENYLSTQKNKTNQSLDLINLGKKRNHWELKSLQLKASKIKPSEVLTKLLLGFNWYISVARADVDALYGD